jgi:hypothetical protein
MAAIGPQPEWASAIHVLIDLRSRRKLDYALADAPFSQHRTPGQTLNAGASLLGSTIFK